MKQEEIATYLKEKWGNYSMGLAMSLTFREDKNYTLNDIKDAFETGFYDFQQLCIKNNIVI